MTWLLRGLAFALAMGAIVAAFIGYRLNTQKEIVQPPPRLEEVIQSSKPLRAGEPIQADDVALRSVAKKPAGGFGAPEQVVGQIPITNIPAGTPLTRAHFPAEGRILRGLNAGERAVAIKVDDVVGLGGFAQPGDRVDVLLYLRGAQETGNASSAQVVLAGVRLLAYGESSVQQPPAEEGENVVARAVGSSDKPSSSRSRTTTTSAVLAIPEGDAPRLMLAASSGTLRLSLRPIDSPATTTVVADTKTIGAPDAKAATPATAPVDAKLGANIIRLAELAQTTPPPVAKTAAKKPAARGAEAPAVVIHDGETIRAARAPSR